jgi:hypothetical protein
MAVGPDRETRAPRDDGGGTPDDRDDLGMVLAPDESSLASWGSARSTRILPWGEAGSAALQAPEVGPEFGRYELLGEVGRGGMGVVYKARHKDLDRLVAIKMILSSHLATPAQVERFYAEARAAARLRHPHVVGIHEVGETGGQHYFAMEYVDGSGDM